MGISANTTIAIVSGSESVFLQTGVNEERTAQTLQLLGPDHMPILTVKASGGASVYAQRGRISVFDHETHITAHSFQILLEAVQHIHRDLGDPPLISFAVLDRCHHVSLLLFEIAQSERGTFCSTQARAQEQHQERIITQPTLGAPINGHHERAGFGLLERGMRAFVFDGKAADALTGIARQHPFAHVLGV